MTIESYRTPPRLANLCHDTNHRPQANPTAATASPIVQPAEPGKNIGSKRFSTFPQPPARWYPHKPPQWVERLPTTRGHVRPTRHTLAPKATNQKGRPAA